MTEPRYAVRWDPGRRWEGGRWEIVEAKEELHRVVGWAVQFKDAERMKAAMERAEAN